MNYKNLPLDNLIRVISFCKLWSAWNSGSNGIQFIWFLKFWTLTLWVHGPNIYRFDFLAFVEAMHTLACAKSDFLKQLDPTVNLNILNRVSEELWEIFTTLLPWEKNNCPSNLSPHTFSSLTEECVSWRKMKSFEVT